MSALPSLAATFEHHLRGYGVRAGSARSLAFAQALASARPERARDLYWIARIALLPSIEDLERFERAFASFFGMLLEPAQRAIQSERLLRAPSARQAQPGRAAADQLALATSEEHLRERDFASMTPAETTRARALLRRLAHAGEWRRSRRRIRGAERQLDMPATMRASNRTAGEIVRLRWTKRRRKLRPIFFLLDLSGSMEPYARALLTYAAVMIRARRRVRAFGFATRLSEVSAPLRERTLEAAIARVAAEVHDWGGGTRIGASLQTFNRDVARRGATRGGTIVILSDGWERDDPAALVRSMCELRRLARRIIWVNPQKRHPAYEPLVKGMAAAMPYIDIFLAGHNLRALENVAAAIEGAYQEGSA